MLLDLRSLGCGLCVSAAAQFEASPRESGISVGAGSQHFVVLGCCGRVHRGGVLLLCPTQPREALPPCNWREVAVRLF